VAAGWLASGWLLACRWLVAVCQTAGWWVALQACRFQDWFASWQPVFVFGNLNMVLPLLSILRLSLLLLLLSLVLLIVFI
jgi:hypothetical protein